MSIIQCCGFTVEPLGAMPWLPWLSGETPDPDVAAFAKTNFFASARVTIEATGETQILQVFGDDQGTANLVAMEYGNKRAGNTV
jgi:hypothetical protein